MFCTSTWRDPGIMDILIVPDVVFHVYRQGGMAAGDSCFFRRSEAVVKSADTFSHSPHYHVLEYDQDQIGDIYLVACGQERCDPEIVYGPKLRECFHLHVIRSGKGILRAGGKILDLREGDLFMLKHKEIVEYEADASDPWSYCWVTFFGSEAEELSEEIGFSEGVYSLHSRIGAEPFHQLILRMMQYPEMNAVSGLRRRGILLEFLALAIEATNEEHRSRQPRQMDTYIRRAEDFIRYYYASVQVSDVIRYVGFTRAYFTTAFRKKTGMSVKDYLTKIRIDRSKILLENTDLLIQEISEKVGYQDPLHFSRIFHDWCEVTPTMYRIQSRSGKTKNVSKPDSGF